MRNGISAVLIVKNEEAVLDRCLKSLGMVDEIVVVDTGSTDKTIEIAKDHTGNVQVAPPIVPFHFAQARNLALQYAHEDWIVTIDADEIAHPNCIEEIRKAFWRHGAASAFNVKFIVSSEGGLNPASMMKMKVFRRGRFAWEHRIHEILTPMRNPANVKVFDLPEAVMEHLPVADKTLRSQQNLELLKISVKESPEYIRNSRQLGMELFAREQYRDALPYLQLYLDSGTGGPLDRSETLLHMARCHQEIGVHLEAIRHFDLAIAEAPIRRECYYFKALATIKEGHPDAAIPILEACLAIPEGAKPDFYLNLDRVWDGTYPKEALQFCQNTMAEHLRTKGR